MTTQTVPGTLIATADAQTLAREAATRVRKCVDDVLAHRPFVNIAVSGGSTPQRTYELFARETGVPFDRIRVFFVDERAVPPDHERSNFRAFSAAFAGSGGSRPEIHRMLGEIAPEEAARHYAQELERLVPPSPRGTCALDLIILGVGSDGHTASLFPGEPAVNVRDTSVTHAAATKVHEPRITLTAPVIEAAHHVLTLAQGKEKTPALERVWNVRGSLDETPARVVRQATGYVTWVVDREAAGL